MVAVLRFVHMQASIAKNRKPLVLGLVIGTLLLGCDVAGLFVTEDNSGETNGDSTNSGSTPSCDRGPGPEEPGDYDSVITVTNANDSGTGSLRAALSAPGSAEAVVFDSNLEDATILLDSELYVETGITIDGGNAPDLTLSGNEQHRVFRIESNIDVTLRNLTIVDGRANNSGEIDPDLSRGRGGAIITENEARLTIENSTLKGNIGDQGGAVFSGYKASLIVRSSLFENNQSQGNTQQNGGTGVLTGGAISAQGETTGELRVHDSVFRGNTGVNGGAIGVIHTAVTIDNSTFTDNGTVVTSDSEQTNGHGGAIYTDGASGKQNGVADGGEIRITNSLITNNQAYHEGGGALLFTYDPDTVTIEGTSFEGNTVKHRDGYGAFGGGLRNGGGAITIRNSAFINNVSENKGGGIYLDNYSPGTIENTTVSGNVAREPDNGGGQGGGIMVATDDPVTLRQVTIAENTARFQGGGFSGKGDNTTLIDSIFDRNVAENNGNNWDIKHHTTDALQDGGGNYQWPAKNPDDSTDLNVTSTVNIADPNLGELTRDEECGPTYHPVPNDSPAAGKGAQSVP